MTAVDDDPRIASYWRLGSPRLIRSMDVPTPRGSDVDPQFLMTSRVSGQRRNHCCNLGVRDRDDLALLGDAGVVGFIGRHSLRHGYRTATRCAGDPVALNPAATIAVEAHRHAIQRDAQADAVIAEIERRQMREDGITLQISHRPRVRRRQLVRLIELERTTRRPQANSLVRLPEALPLRSLSVAANPPHSRRTSGRGRARGADRTLIR